MDVITYPRPLCLAGPSSHRDNPLLGAEVIELVANVFNAFNVIIFVRHGYK